MRITPWDRLAGITQGHVKSEDHRGEVEMGNHSEQVQGQKPHQPVFIEQGEMLSDRARSREKGVNENFAPQQDRLGKRSRASHFAEASPAGIRNSETGCRIHLAEDIFLTDSLHFHFLKSTKQIP